MKKRLLVFIAIFAFVFASFGCGEKKEIIIDSEALTEKLSEAYLGGKNELVELDEESGYVRYGIKDLYSYFYCCASVTVASDELVFIEAKDEESAHKIYDLMEAYRNERIELFASYAAGEVSKLEDALLERAGKYVIFVVSDDVSAAKKLFKEAKDN